MLVALSFLQIYMGEEKWYTLINSLKLKPKPEHMYSINIIFVNLILKNEREFCKKGKVNRCVMLIINYNKCSGFC